MNEEDRKKLFVALVTEEETEEVLEEIVNAEEYNMATNGGEPDLVHLMCLRLLEALRGERELHSMMYDKNWRERVLKKDKGIRSEDTWHEI